MIEWPTRLAVPMTARRTMPIEDLRATISENSFHLKQ